MEINSVGYNPQSYSGLEEYNKFKKASEVTDKINEHIIMSNDIKKPVTIAASVALAGFTAYKGTKELTNTVLKKFAPNAGVKIEKGLRSAANTVKTKADELAGTEPAKTLSTDTIKKYTGKALGTVEEGARNLYKKVAYAGIEKETVDPLKASLAISNLAGTTAGAAVVADICTKDSNKDGVADIMQKSQNAYTGSKTNTEHAFEALNILSEAAQVLA